MVLSKGVLISILVLILLLIPTILVYFNTVNHPNAGLNAVQLIKKFGYRSESHYAVTKDGYIITLYRISQKSSNTTNKHNSLTPVLLFHGIYSNAAEFICTGPGKALGLLLADNNYDVWLGNFRGTTWSRNHTKLDPDKDKEFWNFTLDELTLYDFPASIDYILNKTEKSQLNYIGFSQGAGIAVALLSERTEYLKKIKFISLLSPAVFMKNSESPGLMFAASIQNVFKIFLLNMGNLELFPSRSFIASVIRVACNNKNSFLFYFCKSYYYFVQQSLGFIDVDDLPVIATNLPAGISALQQMHALQFIRNGEFEKFDWGREANLVRYGQEKPPGYDLSKITAPISIYYAKNDKVVNARDVKRLIKSLPNVVEEHFINHDTFNHLDFVFASNTSKFFYHTIFQELEKY